jgi:ATP synthase protein I
MRVMNFNNSEKNNNDLKEKRKWAEYSSVGLMFPVSIAVGLATGYFLDKLFNTSPYLLIIFIIYGVVAGFVNLIKVTKKNGKRKKG